MSDHDADKRESSSGDDDSSDLSERISDALQPALSSMSLRVAKAVMSSLDSDKSDEQDVDTDDPDDSSDDQSDLDSEKPEEQDDDAGGSDDSSNDQTDESEEQTDSDNQSLIGKAVSGLSSSVFGSWKDATVDQLESMMDSVIEGLFSKAGRRTARRLADQTLQATLYDSLKSIDDRTERNKLYRETLSKLRPIVRKAVDSMFTWQTRQSLKRDLHGAIPSIVNGDFGTAFQMIVDSLSEVTNHAEQVVWDHSGEVLEVFQEVSTDLIEANAQEAAEDKINPEEIQQRVQEKAEQARNKLQETVTSLQDGVGEAQDAINQKMGKSARGSGPGMPPSGRPPTGMPPSGRPPNGMPPSGMPPTGMPPDGAPPSGAPPNGVHPAVARMQQNSRQRSESRRRLPET